MQTTKVCPGGDRSRANRGLDKSAKSAKLGVLEKPHAKDAEDDEDDRHEAELDTSLFHHGGRDGLGADERDARNNPLFEGDEEEHQENSQKLGLGDILGGRFQAAAFLAVGATLRINGDAAKAAVLGLDFERGGVAATTLVGT